jgi:Concanavalin A-like lectin/glucanases superfamily
VTITTQPVSQTLIAGLKATFSVAAGGVNLTYQWKFGTNAISGATNSTFAIPHVSASDAGSYTVVVKGTGSGSVTSAAAVLTVVPAEADCGLTNALIAHLKFDGTYTDSTSFHTDGSAVGSPTFDTGILGKSVHIVTKKDGSQNDYVTLGYPDQLKFGGDATAKDFTVSFWVKVNEQADDQPFISNKDWGSSNNRGWGVFSQSHGNFRVNITGPNGGSDKFNTTPANVVSDATWHLLTVTVNRTNTVNSYVDGLLVDTKSIVTAGTIDTDDLTQTFNLGQDGTGGYTDGGSAEIDFELDDLGIWQRALSADEVACVYVHGIAGKSFDETLPTSGITVSGAPVLGGVALSNVVLNTTTKTITADLPTDLSKPAYVTIKPPVTVTGAKIVGGKLVITYQ